MSLIEKAKSWFRAKEKFKGFFDTGKASRGKSHRFYPGEQSWQARCHHYDRMVEEHGMAKQATVTIAGQLVAEGVHTSPYEREGETYPRAEEAQKLCDDLNEKIGLDTLLYDTGIIMAKYGSCFWEKTWSPVFDVRLIPMQEKIEPAQVNDIGEITEWRQNLWAGKTNPVWSADSIIHFSWNITSKTWPYGSSLLTGLEVVLDALQQLEENARDYMEKQAWPYELWGIGDGQYVPTSDEQSAIRSKWKNRNIGENMITSFPIDVKQGGTGGAPIRELSNLVEFLYNEAIDTTMIPPISRQYNATQASAKVMMPHAHATIITPLQRIIRRKLEGEVYKPYLEDHGFSRKIVPKLLFVPPDAHKEEDAAYYAPLVMAGVFPPKWVARKLGVPLEEWEEWEKAGFPTAMQQQQEDDEEFMVGKDDQKKPLKESGDDEYYVRRLRRGSGKTD